MKKALFGVMALGILFAASCKKSDDGGSSNTWKVGTNSYTAATVTRGTSGSSVVLTASNTNGTDLNNIIFYFNGAPTSGSYKVVSSAFPTASQVGVQAAHTSGGTGTSYFTTGNDNVNATVTVDNSKITVSLPDATAKNISGSDSLKISANLTEN